MVTTVGTTMGISTYSNSSTAMAIVEDCFHAKIMSRPLQAVILIVVVTVAATLNGLVIANIRKNDLKARTVTFVLIQYMCLLDFVGAITMLPFPFYVSLNGGWTLGSTVCSLNAVMNAGVWIQHFVLFMLLKIDRTSAACLPIGRYPLFKLGSLQTFLVLSIVFSFALATTITLVCGPNFHKVILLCTPKVPRTVYRIMLTLYTVVMSTSAICYLMLVLYLKQRQRKICCSSMVQVKDYRHNIHTAFISFNITLTNLVVYVPTMLIIGQPHLQEVLPKMVFLVVDIVFYSEFFLHPVILLVLSTRLRNEIKLTVVTFVNWLLCG